MKVLLNLQDQKVLEVLMTDQFFDSTFGALEYNPEINRESELAQYRKFLKEKSRFKQVVDLTKCEEGEELIAKIKQLYRINYLKDTALATGIDEGVLVHINSIINQANLDVIQNVLVQGEILDQLFETLRSPTLEHKADAIKFLQEVFQMGKGFQVQIRLTMMNSIKQSYEKHRVIDFVAECLDLIDKEAISPHPQEETIKVCADAVEILIHYIQNVMVSNQSFGDSPAQRESIISFLEKTT